MKAHTFHNPVASGGRDEYDRPCIRQAIYGPAAIPATLPTKAEPGRGAGDSSSDRPYQPHKRAHLSREIRAWAYIPFSSDGDCHRKHRLYPAESMGGDAFSYAAKFEDI